MTACFRRGCAASGLHIALARLRVWAIPKADVFSETAAHLSALPYRPTDCRQPRVAVYVVSAYVSGTLALRTSLSPFHIPRT